MEKKTLEYEFATILANRGHLRNYPWNEEMLKELLEAADQEKKAYAREAVLKDRQWIIAMDPVKRIHADTIQFYTIDAEAIDQLPIELP